MRAIVSPVSYTSEATSRGLTNIWVGIAQAESMKAEIERLRLQSQAASMYEQRVSYLQSELDELSALAKLPEYAAKTKIPARITGFFPSENRVTLNVGRKKGIKPGMPVLAGAGLIGVVQTSDDHESQALVVSSPQLRIGAVVNRNPAPAGLIRGESASKMILEIVDVTATIQTGDAVMTSGHSTLIPGGIPIGRIAEVALQPEYGSVRCQVFPLVQVGNVRSVVVLR